MVRRKVVVEAVALILVWAALAGLALWILVGCAGPGDVEIGVGKSWGAGGWSVHDSFNEQPGGEMTGLDLDFEQGDTESAWVAWTIPLGPKPVVVTKDTSLFASTTAPESIGHVSDVGSMSSSDEIDWQQVAIGLVLGAGALFGGQKGREKWIEHREKKHETS